MQIVFFPEGPAFPHSQPRRVTLWLLVEVGHYFIWHAQVLTDVDMDAVVSGQLQVTVKGKHMNVAQVSHGSEKIS